MVVAIYSTAVLARMLADALRESGLLDLTSDMFNVGMLLAGAMILVQGLRERSRGVEVGFALGVAAIAIIGFARGISAAERSHLIENTVLALLGILAVLLEDPAQLLQNEAMVVEKRREDLAAPRDGRCRNRGGQNGWLPAGTRSGWQALRLQRNARSASLTSMPVSRSSWSSDR